MNKEVLLKVSSTLGIPLDTVKKVYKAYWLYIKATIQELPLKVALTKEEFSCLKTNFNIPSLGKLTCTFDRYKKIKNRFKLLEKFRNAEDR